MNIHIIRLTGFFSRKLKIESWDHPEDFLRDNTSICIFSRKREKSVTFQHDEYKCLTVYPKLWNKIPSILLELNPLCLFVSRSKRYPYCSTQLFEEQTRPDGTYLVHYTFFTKMIDLSFSIATHLIIIPPSISHPRSRKHRQEDHPPPSTTVLVLASFYLKFYTLIWCSRFIST